MDNEKLELDTNGEENMVSVKRNVSVSSSFEAILNESRKQLKISASISENFEEDFGLNDSLSLSDIESTNDNKDNSEFQEKPTQIKNNNELRTLKRASISLDNIQNLNDRKFKLYKQQLRHQSSVDEALESFNYFENNHPPINDNVVKVPAADCFCPLGMTKNCVFENNRLNETIDSLMTHIARNEENEEKSKEEIALLKKKIQALNREIDDITKHGEDNEEKLENELKVCKQNLVDSRKKTKNTQETLDIAEESLSNVTHEKRSYLDEINQLKDELKKAKYESKRLLDDYKLEERSIILEYEQRIQIEEKSNENVSNQIQLLEEELQMKDNKIEQFKTENEQLKDYKCILEKRLNQLDESIQDEREDNMDVEEDDLNFKAPKLVFFECDEEREQENKCGVPKCKGVGNVNERYNNHTSKTGCPNYGPNVIKILKRNLNKSLETIDDLKSRITELGEEMDLLNKKNAYYKSQEDLTTKLKAELMSKNSQALTLSNQLKDTEQKLKTTNDEMGCLKSVIIQKENHLLQPKRNLTASNIREPDVTANAYSLNKQIQDLQNRESTLISQVSSLKQQLDEKSILMAENSGLKTKLKEKMREYVKHIDQIESELDEKLMENSILLTKVDSQKIKIRECYETISSLEETLSNYKVTNKKVASSMDSNIDENPPSYEAFSRHVIVEQPTTPLVKIGSTLTTTHTTRSSSTVVTDQLPNNVCNKCYGVFKNYHGVRIHQGKIPECNQLPDEDSSDAFLKCPHCKKKFFNISGVNLHIQREHPGKPKMKED